MTVPIDAALTATLGAAFYTAAKNHLPSARPALGGEAVQGPDSNSLLASPYYLWGMGYNAVVGMGIAVTAYVMEPDWMWMYWLDASRLPLGLTLYVFLMYPAMFTLGFLLADQAEKLRNRGGAMLLAGLSAVLLAFIVLTFKRIWSVGTLSQWESGACAPLIGPGFEFTPLALVLLVGFAPAVVALVVLLKKFARGLG